MIIYKDLITGDELFSNSYRMQLVDGVMYEVEGRHITQALDVGDQMFGGNSLAGSVTEADGEVVISGVNIVIANRLQPTVFDKKSYGVYIKTYVAELKKRLQQTNPERVEIFKTGVQSRVKWILENFKDLEFFTGQNMDPEGMVAVLAYREDGNTPFMCFFKDGLVEEKC